MHSRLKFGVSTIALSAISALGVLPALAQVNDTGVEQVTVTGSSIRGAAPVGSNLITVGAQDIQNVGAQTIGEVLTNVPSITGLGNSGRGGNGNGGSGASVYIHQIGASAQNSTLVLLDGHRMPISGTTNSVADPNNIPQIMIERVDVLAEGASSIYGSDAVAGVVNFVTRKKFDGLEVRAQTQLEMDSSAGKLLSVLTGKSWDTGGFLAAYSYSFEDNLPFSSRWQTNPLIQGQRALQHGFSAAQISAASQTNFGNFNCDPATIQLGGAGNIYLNAQGSAFVTNSTSNQMCSTWAVSDYLPSETRQNSMVKFNQEIVKNLVLSADGSWDTRRSVSRTSRGTLTATAFGPGYEGNNPSSVTVVQNGVTTTTQITQINPFYTNPVGVTTSATTQQIRYNFDSLLGPGAVSDSGDDVMLGDADLLWTITDNWNLDLFAGAGRSDSFTGETHGVVNQGMALLALNGTNQAGGIIPAGSQFSTAVPGSQTIVTQSLTTANALDVWNPAATNRTSAAALDALTTTQANGNLNHEANSYQQYRLVANGTLLDTAAGGIKLAAGVEEFRSQIYEYQSTSINTGPTNIGSGYYQYHFGRHVTSEFLEFYVPVVGPDMHVPFVQKLEFDLSGRHDDYSDVGTTTNPKISFNWDVDWGLRLRGNWSTSFVAPPLILVGDQYGNAGFAGVAANGLSGSLPVAAYPALTQFSASCLAPSPGHAGGVSDTGNCSLPGTAQGITLNGTLHNMKPQRGHGYTLGFDFAPDFLPGFNSSVSWWHTTFLGGITAANTTIDSHNPSMNSRIQLFPTCATAQQIAAAVGHEPIKAIIPQCVSYMVFAIDDNLINFWASGIDANFGYHFDTDYGAFSVDDNISYLTQFLEGFGNAGLTPTAPYRFSVRNTVGLNTTFPNVGTQMRAHLGWAMDSLAADIYMNYTGAYKIVGSPATVITPIGSTSTGVYNGVGGDHVESHATFDVHLAYSFDSGVFGNDQISLTARNVLNESPPFVNATNGFDTYLANPIGRIIEIGLDAKM